MASRTGLVNAIAEALTIINTQVILHNEGNLTNINVLLKNLYCGALNIIFDWDLQKANFVYNRPLPVDLVDTIRRLAVQVTTESSSAKVRQTLQKFFESNLDAEYDRLIILVIGSRGRYNASYAIKPGFDFDLNRDIWDEARLIREITTLDIEKLEILLHYLRDEIGITGIRQPGQMDRRHREHQVPLHELDEIIRQGAPLANLIDRELLRDNTLDFPMEELGKMIQFEEVRHLFIVASPDHSSEMGVQQGGYFSWDLSWLLLAGVEAEQVAYILSQCTGLTLLVICYHDLTELDLRHLRHLKLLEIWMHKKPIRFAENGIPGSLETLDVVHTTILDSLNLHHSVRLKSLVLLNKEGEIRINGLDWCMNLEILNLRRVLVDTIDLDGLRSLKKMQLSLVSTEIRALSDHKRLTEIEVQYSYLKSAVFLSRLTALERLEFKATTIQGDEKKIPDLSHCKCLKTISLNDTELQAVGELPPGLEELSLCRTGLSRIPESVKQLKQLRKLDLSGLHLRELPLWLADLGLPVQRSRFFAVDGIIMETAVVDGVDLSTIPEQKELLREWLEALYHSREELQNEVKVIFLGDGEAGKSHIIKRLEKGGALLTGFDGDSTPGIAITNKEMDLKDRSVTVRAWDFGGQEILHAMHRIFMTKNTLYVVVLNARNDTQDHRAEHWLRFIYSFDQDARVLLVLNKTDQNPRASLNLNRLRRMYPELPDPVLLSAKKDSLEDFNTNFIQPLRAQLEQFEMLRSPFPATWRQVQKKLEGVGKRYILAEAYEEFCEEVGITKANVQEELVRRFMNLGVCFRCDGELGEAFLLLEPKWVTNAIYKILFNHHEKVYNGIISLANLKTCLTAGEKHKSVDRKLAYSKLEVSYILQVMRSYGLSFAMEDDENNEFIPMLCDRNESPLMKEYADDPHTLEVWWQFDYLPDNLLFHLMVELCGELDTDHVWLSGARFLDTYTKHSILVERDGNTLKLYAENKPGQGFASQHLETMEFKIRDVINRRFQGLVEKKKEGSDQLLIGWEQYPGIHRLLVHKLNGKRETFDLVRLEDNPNAQQYSKLLKTTVLAKDLLQWCYRGFDKEQSALIRDLVEACMALQGNQNPYENPRNTYVRDMLGQNKRYDLRDQTLVGEAEGQNEAGELDMEIRRDSGTPWTVFEALNHSDYDTWQRHLTKLLDNYNPHGLKMLLLVVYVDNEKFSLVTKRYSELIGSYSPKGFTCINESAEDLSDTFAGDARGIRIWRCNYSSDVGDMTVWHIFVHMHQ